jgi:hypothetical protein
LGCSAAGARVAELPQAASVIQAARESAERNLSDVMRDSVAEFPAKG